MWVVVNSVSLIKKKKGFCSFVSWCFVGVTVGVVKVWHQEAVWRFSNLLKHEKAGARVGGGVAFVLCSRQRQGNLATCFILCEIMAKSSPLYHKSTNFQFCLGGLLIIDLNKTNPPPPLLVKKESYATGASKCTNIRKKQVEAD